MVPDSIAIKTEHILDTMLFPIKAPEANSGSELAIYPAAAGLMADIETQLLVV